MENKNKAVVVTEEKAVAVYGSGSVNLADILAEEMDGLTPSFDRIKIPVGAGSAFEVPGEDASSPDIVKEFKAVILYHHPIHTYYKEKYTGGNNPPDCGSMDGHTGIDYETGETKDCADCEFCKFGSAESGGKACKQKRRLYLLRENEALPTLLSLPTGSLGEYSKYVMRLLSKGKKTNSVVTKFTLKKAQNAGGISYSQAVFTTDRILSETEYKAVANMTEQVKVLAGRVGVAEEE